MKHLATSDCPPATYRRFAELAFSFPAPSTLNRIQQLKSGHSDNLLIGCRSDHIPNPNMKNCRIPESEKPRKCQSPVGECPSDGPPSSNPALDLITPRPQGRFETEPLKGIRSRVTSEDLGPAGLHSNQGKYIF